MENDNQDQTLRSKMTNQVSDFIQKSWMKQFIPSSELNYFSLLNNENHLREGL